MKPTRSLLALCLIAAPLAAMHPRKGEPARPSRVAAILAEARAAVAAPAKRVVRLAPPRPPVREAHRIAWGAPPQAPVLQGRAGAAVPLLTLEAAAAGTEAPAIRQLGAAPAPAPAPAPAATALTWLRQARAPGLPPLIPFRFHNTSGEERMLTLELRPGSDTTQVRVRRAHGEELMRLGGDLLLPVLPGETVSIILPEAYVTERFQIRNATGSLLEVRTYTSLPPMNEPPTVIEDLELS